MADVQQAPSKAGEGCDVPSRTGGDDQNPHVMILLGECRPGAHRRAGIAEDANGSRAVEVQPALTHDTQAHGTQGGNTVGIGELAARTGLPVKTIRYYLAADHPPEP
ncbi:hypothetical protein P3T27_006369 [Kitasatospora sp. MAA19]|uniref:hypothetical protein n=1 Tax=Kitasatospora sp. MAA19 TaxID=3035090 RepID=UPI002474E079|nr:hypothetical protein [Kitasatospora sp. MAA19]MDH6709621.1 hypothetical protein [Kitasatospora sp. MAA19]